MDERQVISQVNDVATCCGTARRTKNTSEVLHDGTCNNRCNVHVAVYIAPNYPGTYPCALAKGHENNHWHHPAYKRREVL